VELIHRCYGTDLMKISIDLATGREVDAVRAKPRRHYALLALYSLEGGVLEKIEGLEELKTRGGVLHLKLGAKKGDVINSLMTHNDKYGFVVLEDTSPEGVREKARWMREHVRLVLSRPTP